MTSLHRDIMIDASADKVWDAVRDVGRPHERITPGVLTDTRFDGSIRTVTFADGLIVRERIVDIDDDLMRIAYTVVEGPFEHHHASMRIVPDGGGSRLTWTTDLLPDELSDFVAPFIDAGAEAMQRALGD